MIYPLQTWFRRHPARALYVLLLLLTVVPLVYGMYHEPIHLWDESRIAVNAAEMALNRNWLVTHFEGQPDLWNTKPPLLIWLQALCIRLLGFTELAIRLPILAAVIATVSLLYWFSVRVLRSVPAGLFAGLVLLTSGGYFRVHVARSGDYDGLLVLWELLLVVGFFRYLELKKSRDWWLFTAALICAVLTKGVAGLLGLPGLAVYVLWQGKLGELFTDKKLYASIGLFVLLIGGYYAAHEWATPGYWQAVQENELGGRYTTPLNNLGGPWNFYLQYLKMRHFVPWIGFLLPAALLAWLQPDMRQRRAVGLLLLFSGSWLAVISSATTKMAWYEAPVYPALALIVGLGLAWIWQAVYPAYVARYLPESVGLLLGTALIFLLPYRDMTIDLRTEVQHNNEYDAYTAHLKAASAAGARALTVVVPDVIQSPTISTPHDPGRDYAPVFTFYQLAYQQELGLQLTLRNQRQLGALHTADTVVVCDARLREQLAARFTLRPVQEVGACQTLVVEAPR